MLFGQGWWLYCLLERNLNLVGKKKKTDKLTGGGLPQQNTHQNPTKPKILPPHL